MRFQVPQFIDVEDKIFGPLTFKQFVYILGGAGLAYVIYRFVPTLIAIILIAPVLVLALALAFYKVNNKPFINTLQAAFQFFTKNQLYLWQKQPKKPSSKRGDDKQEEQTYKSLNIPRISESKLKDMSWGIEVENSAHEDSRSGRDTLEV